MELEDDEYTLEDHCKLYLLGLPNKLGPLGFLALHSILESAGEAVADIQVDEFVPVPECKSAEPVVEAAAPLVKLWLLLVIFSPGRGVSWRARLL